MPYWDCVNFKYHVRYWTFLQLQEDGTLNGSQSWGLILLYKNLRFDLTSPERLERGGPCWNWEEWGFEEYKWKGSVLYPWLVRWVCYAGTRDSWPALAALGGPVQKYFFSHRTLFYFLCPHRPASWAGGRAGLPVSYFCVSGHHSQPGVRLAGQYL